MRRLLLAAVLFAAPAQAQTFFPLATGRVVDAETGEPIVAATVEALVCASETEPHTCATGPGGGGHVTHADGQFYTDAIRVQVYAVQITHPGYVPSTMPPYDVSRHLPRGTGEIPDYEIALYRSPCADEDKARLGVD